jgi:NCS1 family nucleobase:cation symporter-1
MIWAFSVAKGPGPLWQTGKRLPAASPFDTLWLIMTCINHGMGSLAARKMNGSNFSRYPKGRRHYVIGTVTSCVITSVLV